MATISGIVVGTGGGPGSNRRTLQDVVNELARPVDASSPVTRALAADAFRSAVHKMNRKGLWPWEVLDEDVAITAGSIYSSVTSVIKKPLAMHKLNQSGGVRDERIGYISYDRVLEMDDLNFAADVWGYTIPNLFETGQIRWLPTPNVSDNARFTYYRMTPAPRKESETIEIPEHAIEAYMSLAWYEFLKRLPSQQRPYELAIAMGDARSAFRELSAHVNSPSDRVREVSGYG